MVEFNLAQLATRKQAAELKALIDASPSAQMGGGIKPITDDEKTSGVYKLDWNGGPHNFPEPSYTDPNTGDVHENLYFRMVGGYDKQNVGLIQDKRNRYPGSDNYVFSQIAAEADAGTKAM